MRVPTALGLGLALAAGVVVGSVWIRARPAPAPVTHVVEMRAMAFHPGSVTARAGDTVVWVNRDIVPHTATADDSTWSSPPLDPGARWERVATAADGAGYGCLFHPDMRGRVDVGEPR